MENEMLHRVHPELVRPLKAMLKLPRMNLHDIPALRANPMDVPMMPEPDIPGIETIQTKELSIPGPEGAPDVPALLSYPPEQDTPIPALLWIHGGGYILGTASQDAPIAQGLALTATCAVLSVDYRLAPENPFPAAIEDCYAALTWLASHAGELGIDANRIAIGGASAGGGLAAGLTLLTRDRGEVAPLFQMLIYPMLDDRNAVPASETAPDAFLWTRENNIIGWRSYLGCEPGGDGVSPYASVCRATDVSGLPPTYLTVGELDLFMEESVTYALHLSRAGVPTELHVYPGAYHAFDGMAPDAAISQRFTEDYRTALRQTLHPEVPA